MNFNNGVVTSGVSVQCEMPFKSRGMCAGYNQSKRNPYVRRLFVAIAIPLRSLIKPTSADLTASVRNTASGVDSKLRKTCWSGSIEDLNFTGLSSMNINQPIV
ncbi:hypothetical protein V8G54_007721 [Vigna mungo]|uniref:Uncharacterized protein n=1 Tax=Vigna mungo TaxID=3915 RepID=A0AAQ3P278_VIGMU